MRSELGESYQCFTYKSLVVTFMHDYSKIEKNKTKCEKHIMYILFAIQKTMNTLFHG